MRNREKMPRLQRASQFMPFDAVKGLKEEIKLVELKHEKLKNGELKKLKEEELLNIIKNLRNKQKITLFYYDELNKLFKKVEGESLPHISKGFLEIYAKNQKLKVKFLDIIDIISDDF
ncbi:MAG: hypothetical protein IJ837_04660 [Clostridia bacterium]|nr:hypothetical protein [Clostridia bacterium]